MKRCPTCSRTFEDTFTFCLIDGAVLSAPFDNQAPAIDPSATLVLSGAINTDAGNTAPTKAYLGAANVAPTAAAYAEPYVSPPPLIGQKPAYDAAPAKPFPLGRVIAWFITALACFLVFGLLSFAIYWKVSSTNAAQTKNDNASVTKPDGDTNANRERPKTPTSSTANTSEDPSTANALGGTTWNVSRTGDDNQQYRETLTFEDGGTLVETMSSDSLNGAWNVTGDELVIDVPAAGNFLSKRITATINGDTMSGTFDYLGHDADQYFTAQIRK